MSAGHTPRHGAAVVRCTESALGDTASFPVFTLIHTPTSWVRRFWLLISAQTLGIFHLLALISLFFFLVITPVSLWPSAVQPSLYPFPLTYFVITDWFVSSRILYRNRITQYILFCVISLNIMILKCIHVVGYKLLHACSFPSVTRPVYGWLTFANPLTCWWRSGFFPLGRMMNKAARNIHIQYFLWTCFLFSWVNKYPGAEWVDGMFNFIRNYQFYKMTLPLHLPINSTQEFQLLHILVNP